MKTQKSPCSDSNPEVHAPAPPTLAKDEEAPSIKRDIQARDDPASAPKVEETPSNLPRRWPWRRVMAGLGLVLGILKIIHSLFAGGPPPPTKPEFLSVRLSSGTAPLEEVVAVCTQRTFKPDKLGLMDFPKDYVGREVLVFDRMGKEIHSFRLKDLQGDIQRESL